MAEAPQLSEEQRKALEEKIKNMTPEQLREFQKVQCIFCQIIAGKIPAKKLHDDERCIAILDINPAAKGHLLLIPREHYAIMPQVPDDLVAHLSVVAKNLSQLLLQKMKAEGTTIYIANGLVAGQKSQHFMIHVIPRKEGDDVLEVSEKLVDSEMQQKVKLTIEKKLNEILGLQKEVVSADEVTPAVVFEKEMKVESKPVVNEKKVDRRKKVEEPLVEPLVGEKRAEDVSLDDIADLFK